MLLYHGTSSKNISSIKKEGLRTPYLTNQLELAAYYAECEVDEVGGEKVILEVQVEEESLCFDKNAFYEPVGFGGLVSEQIMENIELDLVEIISKNPTWYVNDVFNVPVEAYSLSLEYVGSCYSNSCISPNQIKQVQTSLSN